MAGRNFLRQLFVACFFMAEAFNVFAKEPVSDLFLKANLFYEKQEYDSAENAFNNILQYDSSFADVWFNLGNVYFRKGQFARAILCYEKAKKLSPADDDIDFNIHVANLKVTD